MAYSCTLLLVGLILKINQISIVAAAAAQGTERNPCGMDDWMEMKDRIYDLISSFPDAHRWPARLLQAGFHDCFVSGCDGSIAFELDRQENIRIDITVHFLKMVIDSTCVSLADALKLGMELSMELTGGPPLLCPLGTSDTTRAGPKGELPHETQNSTVIMNLFRRKGFTDEETLAGNYAGHSIGRFGAGAFAFTPTEDVYDNTFAKYCMNGNKSETQFHALPSDMKLAKDDANGIVAEFGRNMAKLDAAYASFMTKLCAM